MDLHYAHDSPIQVLRVCHNSDALDLVAVAGDTAVDVLRVTPTACIRVASFHIGQRVTALAWSPRTVSPSSSDEWYLELAAASADFALHLLTRSYKGQPENSPFGGGLTGHHGKVNDMAFCGGQWDEESTRYVATVSDDKVLMVWNLYPGMTVPPPGAADDDDMDVLAETPQRPPATAYAIHFAHPLVAIRAHPSASKSFLVADDRGSVFLTDWRSLEENHTEEEGRLRHSSLLELVDPSALGLNYTGASLPSLPSIDWRGDTSEILGGVFGTRFALWDQSKQRGSIPIMTGSSFPDGGNVFRWSRTFTEHFAISAQPSSKGAIIHVYNCNFINAPPTVFTIRSKPLYVRDFDFLSLPGIPVIAAAVGESLIIFSIGVEA